MYCMYRIFFSWELINHFPFISYGKNLYGIHPFWYMYKDLEAESCYVTGEGGAEGNRAQISEVCYTYALTSRIKKKKVVYQAKFFGVQTVHIPN